MQQNIVSCSTVLSFRAFAVQHFICKMSYYFKDFDIVNCTDNSGSTLRLKVLNLFLRKFCAEIFKEVILLKDF